MKKMTISINDLSLCLQKDCLVQLKPPTLIFEFGQSKKWGGMPCLRPKKKKKRENRNKQQMKFPSFL